MIQIGELKELDLTDKEKLNNVEMIGIEPQSLLDYIATLNSNNGFNLNSTMAELTKTLLQLIGKGTNEIKED